MSLARNRPLLIAFRACFWMHFLSAVIVPFYTEWGGLTLAQMMAMNAWFMAWNFALEVPTGAVADVFGRKWSMVLGALTAVAGALLYVSTHLLAVFLCAEVLYAVAYTLVSGAEDALAYDSLVELGRVADAPRMAAQMESGKLFGIIVGALLGSAIGARWGLAAPVGAHAVPALCAAVCAALMQEPTVHQTTGPQEPYMRVLLAGVRRLRAAPVLRLLAFDMVSINAAVWTIIWLYQPLCAAAGLDVVWFGTLHATMCGAQILVLQAAERFEGLVGSARRWLMVSAITSGLGLVGLGLAGSLPVVITLCMVVMAFGLTRSAPFMAYLNHHIASAERATVLSTVSMLRTLAIVVGQLVAGQLTHWSLHGTMIALGIGTIALAWLTRIEDHHLRT